MNTFYLITPGLNQEQVLPLLDEYCPKGRKLLAKATKVPDRAACLESALKAHLQGFGQGELPIGALSALSFGVVEPNGQSQWAKADPCFFKADAHTVYCLGGQLLQLSGEQAQTMIDDLNVDLKEKDLSLIMLNEISWVLKLNRPMDACTNTLQDVLSKSIFELMPTGPDGIALNQLFTDIQLMLKPHPINVEKEQAMDLPVNGLWLYGLGGLPEQVVTTLDGLYSNDTYVQGMGKCANIATGGLPSGLDSLSKHEQCAVVDTELLDIMAISEQAKVIEKLKTWEKLWFGPLFDALQNNAVKNVCIEPCDTYQYQVGKRQLKYFWRNNAMEAQT